MKLTILGSGTCSTIPNISNRKPPAFVVEWEDQIMLFECSEGVRWRLEEAGFDPSKIRHIAISHANPDHDALVQYHQSMANRWNWGGEHFALPEVTIYCPRHIVETYQARWNMQSPNFPLEKLKTKLNFVPLPSSNKISIGTARLSAASMYHEWGKMDAIGFRLETPDGIFVYSGDTGECPGIREIAKGADWFVCEASARVGDQRAARDYGHLSPHDVGAICAAADVKKAILFHYTGLDSDETIIAEIKKAGYGGEIIIGNDFQIFEQ